MNIRHIIHYSFNDASKALVMGTSATSIARARERVLNKTLVTHFEDALAEENIRVFSEFQRGNVDDFGTEALLYSIHVCRVGTMTTADRKKDSLLYIESSLWQVEIDFSETLSAAVYAFNKLIAGNGENKLFIGAQPQAGQDRFINSLKAPASACNGNVYVALIPHPSKWDDADLGIDVWQYTENDWDKLS